MAEPVHVQGNQKTGASVILYHYAASGNTSVALLNGKRNTPLLCVCGSRMRSVKSNELDHNGTAIVHEKSEGLCQIERGLMDGGSYNRGLVSDCNAVALGDRGI
jgi:hypothetical protein